MTTETQLKEEIQKILNKYIFKINNSSIRKIIKHDIKNYFRLNYDYDILIELSDDVNEPLSLNILNATDFSQVLRRKKIERLKRLINGKDRR